MPAQNYLRVLDGQLRIKLREVKGSPAIADNLLRSLLKVTGITYVEANPSTGSVLVFFESSVITDEKVLGHINRFGEPSITSQRTLRSALSIVRQSSRIPKANANELTGLL